MRISEAESQIMRVLWQSGPTAAEDVIRKVSSANDWTEGTIRTLINRLIQKKAIRSRKEAGRATYEPLVGEADYIHAESQGLLDRLFEGEVAPLVAHLAKHRALTARDLKKLKRLIVDLEEKDR
jgi:BlaI family transcriptional regulator, penicillinase repressor